MRLVLLSLLIALPPFAPRPRRRVAASDQLQNFQTTITSTRTARNTVSATISAIARPPTSAMALSDVFIPSAAIAVTRHQRETLLTAASAGAGITPRLLITTRRAKTIRKPG